MVVQADHTRSEITAMESSAGTILDIPPLRSYGGNRIQGFLIDSEHFKWVRQQMEDFSKQLGVSIYGCEHEAMNLFMAIEKRWRQTGGVGSIDSATKHKPKNGVKELTNLLTSVNYETPSRQGRGHRSQGSELF